MLLYDNCWSQVAFHCSFYSAQALSRSSRLGQTSAAIASSAIRSFATTSVICQPSVPIPLVNLTCRGFQRFCPFVQPRPGILRRACSRTIHQSLPLHIECGQVWGGSTGCMVTPIWFSTLRMKRQGICLLMNGWRKLVGITAPLNKQSVNSITKVTSFVTLSDITTLIIQVESKL